LPPSNLPATHVNLLILETGILFCKNHLKYPVMYAHNSRNCLVSLEIYTLFKTKYFLKGGKLLNNVDWNCIVKLLYRTMSQASSYNQSKYLLLALFVIISLICTNFL